MATVKEVISEITNPLRQNDLEARRCKLGLTRVALGRILGAKRQFSAASEGRSSRCGTMPCAA